MIYSGKSIAVQATDGGIAELCLLGPVVLEPRDGVLWAPLPNRKKPRRNEAFWSAAYKQPNLGSGGVICAVPTVAT
jgi:hypothetical protein